MDLADDIAYSTYDFQDALQSGFVSFCDLLAPEPTLVTKVASKIKVDRELKYRAWLTSTPENKVETINDEFVKNLLANTAQICADVLHSDINDKGPNVSSYSVEMIMEFARRLATNEGDRYRACGEIVRQRIRAVYYSNANQMINIVNEHLLALTALKYFVYFHVVNHHQMQAWETSGGIVVRTLFEVIAKPIKDLENTLKDALEIRTRTSSGPQSKRARLTLADPPPNPLEQIKHTVKKVGVFLPPSWKFCLDRAVLEANTEHDKFPNVTAVKVCAPLFRCVCDFIACLTDAEAIELHARFTGTTMVPMLKPIVS
eukprot:m.1414251 g.1414251  ORF g.1414251 m.1414251 type:complete len:316 (-) comp25029_c0_seq9:3075-4022(-)